MTVYWMVLPCTLTKDRHKLVWNIQIEGPSLRSLTDRIEPVPQHGAQIPRNFRPSGGHLVSDPQPLIALGSGFNENKITSVLFLLPCAIRSLPSSMPLNLFLGCKLLCTGLSLVLHRFVLSINAKIHRYTYKAVPEAKNVVVIGGSFAGYAAAKQLSDSLPTGYRVILIEKHTHFQFTWNFPRISVVQGHTKNAFIPYPQQSAIKPEGVYEFRQGEVLNIEENLVVLSDKSTVSFEYLVIATGSQARYPATMDANDKSGGFRFFEEQQQRVRDADNILIVGAGAAGVEVAGDVSDLNFSCPVLLNQAQTFPRVPASLTSAPDHCRSSRYIRKRT